MRAASFQLYRRPVRWLALCCLLGLTAGCATDLSGPAPDGKGAGAPTPSAPEPTMAPVLGPGDQLRLTVYGEDRISGPVAVGADGTVDIPLAGPVPVAGRTPAEAAGRIAAQLRGQLISPRISVSVTSWRPIYIMGEVERAGEYPWRPGLNLMSAVAMAGGATRRASADEIMVQRQGKGSLSTMPLSAATPVLPGDLLKLPERLF